MIGAFLRRLRGPQHSEKSAALRPAESEATVSGDMRDRRTRPANRITVRSIVIGLTLMPANAAYLILAEVLWANTSPTSLSLFYNVVFILFWLVLANLALKRIAPRWALAPAELFVIYTMLSLASAMCSIDMLDVLVSTLPYLTHFEGLEHQYGDVAPHVPSWLTVTDPDAAAAYYLGQESAYDPRIYVPWLRPMALWFCFVMALVAVMGGLDLIFRKPWTQHEKLAYPIIQVPMLLVNQPGELLRNRIFWLGFVIVAGIDLLNGLHYLYPLLPGIPIVRVVDIKSFFPNPPWNAILYAWVSFYPFAIALCFFIPLDLAFSCWFFYIVFKLQRVAAAHFGVHGMAGFPYVDEQTLGGYYALALIALWMTRRHLLRMVRLTLGLDVTDFAPEERREARIALALILGGLAFLLGFSLYHGMTPWIAVYFFLAYYMMCIAVTRMRAELGFPSHDLHYIGPNFQVVRLVGETDMGRHYPRDLAMFGFYNFFTRAYRANPMPHGLEAFRIAERTGMHPLPYFAAMAIAVAAGTILAFWAMVVVFSSYGGSNISTIGEVYGREIWTRTQQIFAAPQPHLPYPAYATIFGILFSLGLGVLRLNLAWWPFHPVGYAVSGSWSMEQLWMAFFTAWLIKLLVLKYGGAKAYHRAIPFFVGMMLGDFIAGTLWSLYGVLTQQDVYHFWPY